jgi:hypothetical protein
MANHASVCSARLEQRVVEDLAIDGHADPVDRAEERLPLPAGAGRDAHRRRERVRHDEVEQRQRERRARVEQLQQTVLVHAHRLLGPLPRLEHDLLRQPVERHALHEVVDRAAHLHVEPQVRPDRAVRADRDVMVARVL